MQLGKEMLGRRHVLPSVVPLLHEIQVEGTFPDGYVTVITYQTFTLINGPYEVFSWSQFTIPFARQPETCITRFMVHSYPYHPQISFRRRSLLSMIERMHLVQL